MGAQGTTTVDFGSFPGTTDASVTVTGQASILSGSLVEAWLFPSATADHSADEHVIASTMLDVIAGEVVAGTGFTIRAVARDMGGESLQPPGVGRKGPNSTTVAQNFKGAGDQIGSVGGKTLNTLWGQFTVAWVWN